MGVLSSQALTNEARTKQAGRGRERKGGRGILRPIKTEAFAALAPRPRLAGSRPAPTRNRASKGKKNHRRNGIPDGEGREWREGWIKWRRRIKTAAGGSLRSGNGNT